MDYLEGALLGRLWSDTDFENRRHRVAVLSLCAVFWLYAFYLIYLQNFVGTPGLIRLFFIWFLIGGLLFAVSPLLCYVYYSTPLPLRWLFLALEALKYYFAYLFLYCLVIPLIRFDKDRLVADLMAWMNGMVTRFFEGGKLDLKLTSIITQVILLALGGLLVVLLLFAVLALVPIFYMKLLKLLQYTIDRAFIYFMRGFRKSALAKRRKAGPS